MGAPLVVLDIPLLFESAHPPDLDGVAVVSTDPATQAARVLARPGMTRDTLAMILARQMPDADKPLPIYFKTTPRVPTASSRSARWS